MRLVVLDAAAPARRPQDVPIADLLRERVSINSWLPMSATFHRICSTPAYVGWP